MKSFFGILVLPLLLGCASFAGGDAFDQHFVNKTLRVDLYHTGTKGMDIYSLDEVLEEGPWPGSRTCLIDHRNLGAYIYFVYDVETNRLIFSRGFCGLFGEWQTTGEASAGMYRTFSESMLLPYPKKKIQLVIKGRDKQGSFRELFSIVIDPNSRFVSREKRGAEAEVIPLFENGHVHKKADILVLGDGYTAGEKEDFVKDCKRLMDVLFNVSPFKERKEDFNVRLLFAPSRGSGPDQPREGIFNHTPFGTSFNFFDLPRYVLTSENKAIRDLASRAPYDELIIIFNTPRYGGGGIFNLYATSSSDNEWSDYTVIHEFGHSFGGLGDEYYASQVSYEEFYAKGVEPWEPNITALLDGKSVKWGDLVGEGTPIPTPWGKKEYEALSTKGQAKKARAHMQAQEYFGKVGCFEGACYQSTGMYRPCIDCIMFSKTREGFCPVCCRAIERNIDFHIQ